MKKNELHAVVFAIVCAVFAAGCSFNGSTNTSFENTNAQPNANTNTEPAATPDAGSAQAQSTLPETLVADLYKQHDAKKSPFFQTKNRALVDKYFAKALADLIWKDATTSAGEVGAIDADPLYNAQDIDIKNFAVGKGVVKNEKATVRVTFTNFSEKKTVNFSLILAAEGWKIDNILYGDGFSLMQWLKDNPETSSSGEFEGKYQVGETTCTVKPVKMAFEVRWAKGSGIEMFAFREGTTFESSADGNGNRFVFDDEDYNTGTFYRADGKMFQVKRAK